MVKQKIEELYFKQSKIWRILLNIVESSRIGSAYLFSGPQGSGKEALAIKFAQFLNCELKSKFCCNKCSSCKRFFRLQHENLNLIFPLPTPKNSNKDNLNFIDSKIIDILIKEIDTKANDIFHKIKMPKSNRILIQSIRNLRKSLYLKNENKGRKIVLIFDSHLLSSGQGESANALLKLLEEPPKYTTFILVSDKPNLLLPTIRSRCQQMNISKFKEDFLLKWLNEKNITKSHIELIAGLCDGNIYQAKFLISQSLDEILLLLSEIIKNISNNKSNEWRDFVQVYSKMANQNYELFSFHFVMLKIWFQSVNRLRKNLKHILHKTSLKLGMKRLIKKFPNADFCSITYEIEKTNLAVSKHLYMPLELTNFLIKVKRHLNK